MGVLPAARTFEAPPLPPAWPRSLASWGVPAEARPGGRGGRGGMGVLPGAPKGKAPSRGVHCCCDAIPPAPTASAGLVRARRSACVWPNTAEAPGGDTKWSGPPPAELLENRGAGGGMAKVALGGLRRRAPGCAATDEAASAAPLPPALAPAAARSRATTVPGPIGDTRDEVRCVQASALGPGGGKVTGPARMPVKAAPDAAHLLPMPCADRCVAVRGVACPPPSCATGVELSGVPRRSCWGVGETSTPFAAGARTRLSTPAALSVAMRCSDISSASREALAVAAAEVPPGVECCAGVEGRAGRPAHVGVLRAWCAPADVSVGSRRAGRLPGRAMRGMPGGRRVEKVEEVGMR
mmetsp:Transcript_4042/g.11481  ORF Transcript_4042/g.11481 Transcript_4042/m.11481 type:complete len:353 (+) Transcript_4042:967-2025(+)